MKRVLVGLSGGVDSARTASLLLEQGYEVIGCYLALCKNASPEGAERVARELGIPLVTVRAKGAFRSKVIRPFLQAWGRGETPNPCVECNAGMKFARLLKKADELGCELVATGHYAAVKKRENGRYALLCGKDAKKDQSYFLWKLSQRQLSRILFPLAEEEKSRVLSDTKSLVPQEQKESMEICFVPHGDTARFVEEEGFGAPAGDFTDEAGCVLGRHKGIHRYTVGQRRGLGIALGERAFVVRIDPAENRVVIGKEEALRTKELFVRSLRFVSASRRELSNGQYLFRGRHGGALIPCRVFFEKGGARLLFSKEIRRFAPGQSACFYRDNALLFGGIIAEKTE